MCKREEGSVVSTRKSCCGQASRSSSSVRGPTKSILFPTKRIGMLGGGDCLRDEKSSPRLSMSRATVMSRSSTVCKKSITAMYSN